ncbi:hypothetical protein JVT61DRAFT_6790 [Boletus reticuloceps]|uniref:Uncharacterized protein n=1 Tax=Boletus reticuloceps TaxID=495285 RepID=A0A8I2YK90_9AGAM|nr:hypothetical protein JVT61DRAFT_6790 [Boletus reticuloceps]
MRLSCALVSSFLCVSAVLVEYHPEKQQPPFLNRVEKSINSTTLIPFNFKWAGAAWTRRPVAQQLPIMPPARSPSPGLRAIIGSGFYIALEAGGTLDDVKIVPNSFPISVGHEIGAIVQQASRTSGVIALINVTTGKPVCLREWRERHLLSQPRCTSTSIKVDPNNLQQYLATAQKLHLNDFVSGDGNAVLCQQGADWAITTLPSLFDIPLANVHMVSLTHIEAHIDGAYKVPAHTETDPYPWH